jgi:sugar phosphate permease
METSPTDPRFARRRWRLFAVLALIYVLVYFYRVSLAVVANDIARDMRLTPLQLGTLSGVLFYVYAVAQLPLGPLIDRFGGRLVISGCGVLTAAGGLLFSLARSLPAAMAARVLIGVGTAAVLMATFTIFSHWYSRQEFGKISGFMVAVGNLGNLAATAPLALAVAAVGWRRSFLAIALLQGVVTLLVFAVVRDRPPRPATAEPAPAAEQPGLFAAWREIFGNGHFWLLGTISFFWYGNYLALQGLWGGPYLMEVLQLSRAQTGRLLMYTSLGFIAGSLLSDFFVRRLFGSHKRALLAGQAALLLMMSAFLGWAALVPPVLRGGLFFAIGVAVSSGVMIYPIIRAMFPLRIVGTALTSLNFFVLLGAAVVQQLMGVIIGARALPGAAPPPSAYHGAFLLPVAGLAAAIVLFGFARDYTRPAEPSQGDLH